MFRYICSHVVGVVVVDLGKCLQAVYMGGLGTRERRRKGGWPKEWREGRGR